MLFMKKTLIILAFTVSLLPAYVLAHTESLTVQIRNGQTGLEKSSFSVPTANLVGGASIAAADLGADGVPEIIVGMGLGNEPRVHVFRQDGSEIGSFLAYAADMGVGINLVVCDLNNDGVNEIITAPMKGGGPHVRLFSNMGELLNSGFFAYNENFRGGVNLACGNLDSDEADELVTLPAAGGGPHARVWKYEQNNFSLSQEFFADESSDARGLVGTIKDKKLFLASSKLQPTKIQTFELTSLAKLIHSFEWTDEGTTLGASGIFSLNNNLILSLEGSQHLTDITAYTHTTITESNFSPRAAAADLDQDGSEEIISIEGKNLFGENDNRQHIVIDLSSQRLSAYENGILANSFLISSAKNPWTTEVGIHSVLAKIPVVDYSWSYGENNPNNYNLGPTPWNLLIYPHNYIHYAWWHNNFGHTMSHGCVNVNLTNMKWLYDWTMVGTSVEILE
jgi:hypothetical protein